MRRWGQWSGTRKSSFRALPDPLSYGLLRYLNGDVDLAGSDPRIGFNYLGRLGGGAEASDDVWRISRDGSAITAVAAAMPMPLMHTVGLNAGAVDTDAGPQLLAGWTWAPSAVDQAQVGRLSALWFEALAGICAHVRGGGGGLTPSDIAPARLSQPEIDELCRHYRIADILPLTPLQQGLLFHASTGQLNHDHVYAVQLDITLSGGLDRATSARRRADRGDPASEPGGPILPTVRRAGADHPGRPRGALALCRPQRRGGPR